MRSTALVAATLLATIAPTFAAPPPAPKADLILVTYVALYQGNAPISSSGGLTMTTLGTYANFAACTQAQSKTQVSYARKGSSDGSFAVGNSLNWGVMCVEKNP
jgi:hypothetical protein